MHFPFSIVDLTQALSADVPTWDGGCGFSVKVVHDLDEQQEGLRFRVQHLSMHAGIGTHMDAPAHCFKGGMTIDRLPIESLLTPCSVIDVSAHAHATFSLDKAHIAAWERANGLISPHSLVVVHTGWGRYWSNKLHYRNELNFPTISAEAAEYLLERNIAGIGIDTLSPDRADEGFPVHEIMLGAQKFIIENLAPAQALPPTGSFSLALPMKIMGATEAPVRLVALVPK